MSKVEKRKYNILIKNTDIKLKVSQRTYYIVLKNEVGQIKEDGYEISINALRNYPRLYNRVRTL